ncbi:MAG TPA: hypothetical protein VJN02_08580 [Gammaproteobacteria bacterium]|nr:hypothetical protein [Gammaproteobacteria bacterium]
MQYRRLIYFLLGTIIISSHAAPTSINDSNYYHLSSLSGFFRFSYDNNIKMPNHIQAMGLLGLNYFADITPTIYGGLGGYGAIRGTQGGLFSVGVGAGLHRELIPNWWGDVGLFVGGGGGRASLVGGGLMLRPSIGVAYAWSRASLGLHYSYIGFPSGEIHSQQVGIDLDLPVDFYYLSPHDSHIGHSLFNLDDIHLPIGKFISFQRNDFALLLQAYRQHSGTKNTDGEIQDGTIKLVGAELNHYFTDNIFWWLKTSGAFSGIPNGYMDVLGGLGYHYALGSTGFAFVPQLGVGAGGGGAVDTGGGFLINPLLGIEYPVAARFALRLSSGYLWAPHGALNVVPITGEILYHLDIARENSKPSNLLADHYDIQGWRIQFLNQTYIHPQRTISSTTSSIELIGVQIDQLFSPLFFLSYQAMGAYSGFHAGGYATGMIGPGIQSKQFFHHRLQFFAEVLLGTGGGGGLALSGGSLIEPVVGVRYAFTPILELQASVSQMKALQNDLNTPALNVGLAIRFDTLNRA